MSKQENKLVVDLAVSATETAKTINKAAGKPLIHAADLAPAGTFMKAAIIGEDKAHDAWRKGAKALYGCGLRYSMIGGADQDKATRSEVSDWIVSMLPEKMRRLLTLKGRDVAELSDADKVQRKMYQQRIGVYLSRIAKYLADHEGITTERGKKKDAGTVADNMPDASTYSGAIQRIEQVMQNAAKLPAIDAVSLAFVQNHCEELLVSLRAAKAKADKLAK